MNLQNKTSQKIISLLLIVLILAPVALFSKPKQADAFSLCPPTTGDVSAVPVSDKMTTGNTGLTCLTTLKEWAQKLLEIAEMAIAKQLIAQLTQSIVNWINSGFHGSPTFLQNPDSFFGDIMKSQVEGFVDVFGYDLTRYPFGRDFALSAINSYKSTLENNAAFTMSQVMTQGQINDLTNFPTGGWNGFFIKTQYPQNNYIGFQMMASNELSKQIAGTIQTPATALNSLLQQGQGFLSPQKCMDNGGNNSYNNGYNNFIPPSWHCPDPEPQCSGPHGSDEDCIAQHDAWRTSCENQQAEWEKTHVCHNLVNTTPGTVVADQIKQNLSSSLRQTELATALGDSVAAIVDAFINKLVSTGLNELADTISPQPTTDNWSYGGQTLDGGNGGGGGGGRALNIPQNVSIQLGGTNPASTQISGGTPPYSIKATDPVTPDTTIATASVSGSTLSITGIAPGQTTVTVKDSSPNVKKVTISITVVAAGDLMVVPTSITVEPGSSVTAVVSGGSGTYSMTTSSDENIALSSFSSKNLVVVGLNPGQTSVVIQDTSTPAKTITVPVNVTSTGGTLTASPANISVEANGGTATSTLIGGSGTYSINPGIDATVATADILGNIITITGVGVGSTSVTIKDDSATPQTTTINVTVVSGSPL